MKFNENSNDVLILQRILNTDPDTMVATTSWGSPGYETVHFGPATRQAIIKFQNKYKAELETPSSSLGQIDQKTLLKLNILSLSSAINSLSQQTQQTSNLFATQLSRGMKGENVKKLQIFLNQSQDTRVASTSWGSPGYETFIFGPATKYALIKYQNKYSLNPTGILDQATIAKINSELSSSSTVAQQTSQTTTNPTFTATTTTGGFAGGGGSSVGGGGSSTTVTITPPPVPTTAPVQTTYTIIATANAGGTITPNGTTTVTANASKSFSITPNSNYQITSVLIDNQAVNSASTYNFANIQTNHTIAVTFSAIAAASNNNQANNVVSTFIQPQITKTFTDYASPVKLGMNNGKPSSWTRDMSFVDLKHILRPWGGSNPWEADPNMKYDSEKYPLTDASTMTEMYNYPLGTYKLSYEGGGLIDLDERYMGKIQNRKIVNNKTTADIVIDSKSSFLKLRMSGNTLENPIRNIQIITPGYQPGQIFTDEYIKAMRPFKIIRFMDWNNTNTSKDIHWSDRYKPTDGQYSGFSYEMMIALGNAIKRDIWIDVPDQADDNYIENLAKLIHDQLDPSLTAYIEYSNEVWNYAFPQWKRVYAASQLNNELTADPITNYSARIQQQVAFQTKKIADIFKKEYGSEFKKRVKVVLAGQSVNPWIITQSLDFLEQKYGSNLSDYLGALSMAVYIHPPKKTDTPLTMDGLFNALNNYVDEQVRPRIKIHKSLAQ
ncbi:MAG: peptidoglycan-binding protein, partial [Patescibacteria group bacterium]